MPRSDIFLRLLSAINTMSKDEALALLVEDIQWVFKPESSGTPAIKDKSGVKGMLAYLEMVFGEGSAKFTTSKVHETTEGVVIVEAESNGTSKLGSHWHNEYIFIVEFNGEGDRIVKITEFLDSKSVTEFGAREVEKMKTATATA